MSKKFRQVFGSVKGGTKADLWEALNVAKGKTAESNVLAALENEKPKWFISAKQGSHKEDHNGIDIIVFSYDEDKHIWEIPIEIKSSVKGLMEHIQHRREKKGKFIPCIVVLENDTDKVIVAKVKSAIKLFVRGRERFLKKIKRSEKNAMLKLRRDKNSSSLEA